MKFCTLDQAKMHIRSDTNDEDNYIGFLIESASESVYQYIKSSSPDWFDDDGFPVVDSDGISEVPQNVRNATLMLIGYLYRDRDNNGLYKQGAGGNFEHGFLPRPVISLLYPYRLMAMG